ncbi:hypothetical protein GLOTRDRAFT_50273 [Gloeophyllum trabeum ATCC 11539]|uniref:BTB domain-containing protein n=1 Tax=Gloeophyllum trabeum (strain ATCC 11539 / FP-39264 / Madison 617) TaxID=670483 RepID=S7PTG6_GLOTA|nr:uncharacterized protein GLOTRDRAFT_50273 [Gloeophyllum trabeum ATCC 11539]EPQ50723.1 hypothetical protein GLOTRDRAFT_50273 [Gloeophyllum trabeum ATCC 11539]
MLCKVSPVFADMFTLPPSNVNESFEGSPVVRMPDGAEVLEQLLKILYQEANLPLKRLDPNTPAQVGPLFEIAAKYEIDNVRSQIVQRLTEDWPTTLYKWDTLEAEIEAMNRDWHFQHKPCGGLSCPEYLDKYLPEPVSAIQLAKKHGVRSILPAAFYHLSRLSIQWGPDGSERNEERQRMSRHRGVRTAKWKSLSAEDHYCLHVGRARLKAAVDSQIRGWTFSYHFGEGSDEDEDEPDDDPCSESARWKTRQDILEAVSNADDVLHVLRRFTDVQCDELSDGLCSQCLLTFTTEARQLRRDLWGRLPEFFELDLVRSQCSWSVGALANVWSLRLCSCSSPSARPGFYA